MKKALMLVLCFALALLLAPSASMARIQFVTIGTGGVTGVYYPTGGAISRMVNKKSKIYNMKATVESTGGSVRDMNGWYFTISSSSSKIQNTSNIAQWGENPYKR